MLQNYNFIAVRTTNVSQENIFVRNLDEMTL